MRLCRKIFFKTTGRKYRTWFFVNFGKYNNITYSGKLALFKRLKTYLVYEILKLSEISC